MTSLSQHILPSKQQEQEQQTQQTQEDDSPRKRRKISRIEEEELKQTDKIDPVEKLLSLSNINQDFLLDFDSQSELSSEDEDHYSQDYTQEDNNEENLIEIENVDFTKIIQDNIRQFYVKRRLENQYKDTFSLLNKKKEDDVEGFNNRLSIISQHQHQQHQGQQQYNSKPVDVPFFKSVNFGNKPKEYTIDDYFSYNEDENEDEDGEKSSLLGSPRSSLSVSSSSTTTTTTTTCSDEEFSDSDESDNNVSPITTPKPQTQSLYIPKINHNHYYYHCGLGWGGNGSQQYNSYQSSNNLNQQEDLSKILNKNSLLNGKASEMVSTGNFMINDFFL